MQEKCLFIKTQNIEPYSREHAHAGGHVLDGRPNKTYLPFGVLVLGILPFSLGAAAELPELSRSNCISNP